MVRSDLEQWKAREVARLLALVDTERRYYQEIVATVPVGLLILSPELKILSSNREVRRIFGSRRGDPVGGQLDTLLPTWVLEKVREVLDTGVPQNNILVQMEREAGTFLRVSIQSIRSWDDETEREALVTIEDVSGTAALSSSPVPASVMDAQLEASPVPSSDLLQTVDAIIWAVELPSKQFLYVNDKAQDFLGFPAEKWLETAGFWSERIHPEDRDWVLKSYDHAIENCTRHSCEYRAQTSSGRAVWLRETARILLDEQGQTKHLIGIAVEVTQRRLLEEQVIRSQRGDAVAKLGSRVSHEINNLLTVVSGYSSELTNGLPPTHPLYGDLQEILSAADRLRGVAEGLAGFARRPELSTQVIDLAEFISALGPKLHGALGERIQLDMQMFPATIGVQADAAQLEQLMLALGERGRRVMRDGGKLTIECSPLEINEDLHRKETILRPGVYAVLSIEDTGPTPDPDTRAAMFESIPALRDHQDESAAVLSRVYPLVRQWGGNVSVSVNSPQGAVFQVFLPRIGELIAAEHSEPEAVPVETSPQPAPEPAPVVKPERETILIAEDDAGIRGLVKNILRRQNYAVLDAASADEAVKTTREHTGKVDLLIADVTASDFDGIRLAEKIISANPGIKVLYLSGYTDDPSAQPADLPEGAAFLQKPFTLGSLLKKVKEVLEADPK